MPDSAFSAVNDSREWNNLISALPYSHILQSWEWGEFKSRYGWNARRFVWDNGEAAAQILTRSALRGAVRVLYVPKGPLLDWSNASLRARVLDDLQSLARRERAILIKIDPDLSSATDIARELAIGDWRLSPDQIQFRNTALLDLARDEAEILAAMKQKTRYNIRLAERKGVRVRLGAEADLDLLYRMYAETSLRDGFVIRSADYYREAWGRFIRAGLAQPFIAEVGDDPASSREPVGGLVLFTFARTAWYMYGMSRAAHREKMPNHLLQWEAMRWAKANGCDTYDFWGAPDEFVETDPMWGVWKFKEGFGARPVRHIGAWDYAPSPLLYKLYTSVLPRVLEVMRRRGKAQTQRALE
jgi:lipid II:glycine glycyltransferase (peptidoglycan interpeptide bridge formation enzyme)